MKRASATCRWHLLALIFAASFVAAQENFPAPPPPPAFTQQELDDLLAPVALYPDPLLSQILMAATYPLEVVEAARWSQANPGLEGDDAVRQVEGMDWDPSVKSLVAFPQVLTTMNENLDWTEQLGEAFLAQEQQVMDTVQNLRQRAYAAGNLRSTDELRVEPEGQAIAIEPLSPELIYVPYYDPLVIYGAWWWPAPPYHWRPFAGYHVRPGFSWGVGIRVSGGFFFGAFDWRDRRVNVARVNNYYYRPAPHAAPGVWRHDPAHRRGIVYRNATLRQQYSHPEGNAAAPAPRMRSQQAAPNNAAPRHPAETVSPPTVQHRERNVSPAAPAAVPANVFPHAEPGTVQPSGVPAASRRETHTPHPPTEMRSHHVTKPAEARSHPAHKPATTPQQPAGTPAAAEPHGEHDNAKMRGDGGRDERH